DLGVEYDVLLLGQDSRYSQNQSGILKGWCVSSVSPFIDRRLSKLKIPISSNRDSIGPEKIPGAGQIATLRLGCYCNLLVLGTRGGLCGPLRNLSTSRFGLSCIVNRSCSLSRSRCNAGRCRSLYPWFSLD